MGIPGGLKLQGLPAVYNTYCVRIAVHSYLNTILLVSDNQNMLWLVPIFLLMKCLMSHYSLIRTRGVIS